MPGPYPGMDPYLEDRSLWRGVYHQLIVAIAAALNAVLPTDFVARIDVRLYVLEPDRSIYPDITVARPFSAPDRGGRGSAATLALPNVDAPVFVRGVSEDMREGFIEIVAAHDLERVVTAIEILSPANKAPGHEGRDAYVRKQQEILQRDTHLLQIDLLREGAHTLTAPRVGLLRDGTWDYLVCLHRAGQRGKYEFWRNIVRQRLPRVRVPSPKAIPT